MISPVELDLSAQRHAPFPSVDPFVLRDSLTGVPLNLTGATVKMQVRLYEGAPGDALLDKTLTVTNAIGGEFGPPPITEADHEALIAAPLADQQTLQGRLRLRYDIKIDGAPGMPASFIAVRGFYFVQTGVTV